MLDLEMAKILVARERQFKYYASLSEDISKFVNNFSSYLNYVKENNINSKIKQDTAIFSQNLLKSMWNTFLCLDLHFGRYYEVVVDPAFQVENQTALRAEELYRQTNYKLKQNMEIVIKMCPCKVFFYDCSQDSYLRSLNNLAQSISEEPIFIQNFQKPLTQYQILPEYKHYCSEVAFSAILENQEKIFETLKQQTETNEHFKKLCELFESAKDLSWSYMSEFDSVQREYINSLSSDTGAPTIETLKKKANSLDMKCLNLCENYYQKVKQITGQQTLNEQWY